MSKTISQEAIEGLLKIFEREKLLSEESHAGDLARAVVRLERSGGSLQDMAVLAMPFAEDLGSLIESGGDIETWHPKISEESLRKAVRRHFQVKGEGAKAKGKSATSGARN